MTKTNKKKIEEFIRVDHAGERGAVKIYEGQLLALNTFVKDDALKKTIEEMKLHEKEHCDFFETEKGRDRQLFLVFNPPYDERISIDNVERFYANIGNTLKRSYPDSQAWMITSNLEALKYVGLRPSKKIKLFNGKLESKLVQYEMYAGSKKAKKQ